MQYCQMNFNTANVEKYAYISLSVYFFAFTINSFNNNLSSNCQVNNIVVEKKKEKKKKRKRKARRRRRNAYCDTMLSIIFLLYTSYNCILYHCTRVYMRSCFVVLYIYCTLIYICRYRQYSIIQYCTLLCHLCTRLINSCYILVRLLITLLLIKRKE